MLKSETDNLPGATRDTFDQALLIGRRNFLGFLVKKLSNPADAEDVLQEFCIRVLTRKNQLRDAERMNAWLYSILRSALNDHYRKTGRRERLGKFYTVEMENAGASADASEAFASVCACVQGLVSELRPADAELIRRIDIDDESRKTVATDLGLSAGTLAVRLYRARAALRDKLLGHCGCCCEHGFEDCSCPPAGCHSASKETHCAPEE